MIDSRFLVPDQKRGGGGQEEVRGGNCIDSGGYQQSPVKDED